MRQKFKIILLLCIASQTQAQFLEKLSLRGKILGDPGLLEDNLRLNGTLGVEYEFTKNQSFGIDYIYYQTWTEYDTEKDENTNIYSTEQAFTILADYRYYFKPFNIQTGKFYLSAYYRNTKKTLRSDHGRIYETTDRVWGNYKYNDIGLALGYKIPFGIDWDKIGMDANFGMSYRNQTETYSQITDIKLNTIAHYDNVKSTKWVPSIRLNFYFNLGKIKN